MTATEQFWTDHAEPCRPPPSLFLTAAILHPTVRRLPVGGDSVEQWIDNADVLSDPSRRSQLTDGWLGKTRSRILKKPKTGALRWSYNRICSARVEAPGIEQVGEGDQSNEVEKRQIGQGVG